MNYAIELLLEEEDDLLAQIRVYTKLVKNDGSWQSYLDKATPRLRDIQNALSTLQDIAKDEE